MKTNAKTQTHERETATQKPMSEMADKAMKNYEQAIRTGLKFQEEATHWWTTMLNQTASTHDWQKRVSNITSMANGMMPAAQRRMEECLELMEKNSRAGAELVKKAVDATQTPVIAESQAKWMDVCTSSLGGARSNAEALTQISTRAIDSWIDFVRKNTEITEIRVPKTAY